MFTLNVLINYIPFILLKIVGAVGKLDTTHLDTYRYDRYSQSDNESFYEVHQLGNLLNSCKSVILMNRYRSCS